MTQRSILSIGDFALMTELPARTLRYYHFQGLLVPAEIGESGYRGYTFEQTHQALLIMALRRSGVSIRQIRDVLNTPGLLPEVLTKNQTELTRQRNRQDNAMENAWQLSRGWPRAEIRNKPAATAIIRQVSGETATSNAAILPQRVRVAAEALRHELTDAGVEIIGPPWCQYALRTPEDKAKSKTSQGPDWLVAVDLHGSENAPHPLPINTDILNITDSQELIVHLPAVPTMVSYAAAIEYLIRTSLEHDLVPDFSRLRYTLENDHVEIVLAVNADEPA